MYILAKPRKSILQDFTQNNFKISVLALSECLILLWLSISTLTNSFIGQINNFGDTLQDCLVPTTIDANFCSRNIATTGADAPDSVLRYRTNTGICNNIETGKGAVGAGNTVLPRLRREFYNALNERFSRYLT